MNIRERLEELINKACNYEAHTYDDKIKAELHECKQSLIRDVGGMKTKCDLYDEAIKGKYVGFKHIPTPPAQEKQEGEG